MSIISRMRKQVAVYWPMIGTNDAGEPIYGPPEEIKCRWEDVHEVFKTAAGDDTVSNSKVYVDRETPEGGVLWEGSIEDLENQMLPFENDGAYAIRKFSRVPNLKATESLLIAML